MTTPERNLAAARRDRDAARAALDGRVEGLRAALDGQSLTDRAKQDALRRVEDTTLEALDVARESRWVIAGTVAALLAWLLRRPLLGLARRAAARWPAGEPAQTWDRCRAWIVRKVKP